ncbi:uncharacterized protein EMH_0086100 [Eimeria mitis]|uniref:Uncharacterized protein n=1 Tax=Eimeria mitis TaxID=44415 RepID=U6KI39_9EIME|nr:uncharacterized protein EMH_0086100 [Eimeria mitis]CDJ36451.1 hypothetical protein EMH_0086100 [Eimeria mitis]
MKRSQNIAQTIAESSAGSSGSPLTAVKTAIEDSVSALSRLYEASRKYGLSLAQGVQKERPPFFSEEEMQLLEDDLGKGFREFMDFREQNMKSSFPIFVQKAEKAAVNLEALRRLETTDDLHLLVAVARNLETVKVVSDAVQILSRSSDIIRSSAAAVLRRQHQREHASIRRDLEGKLGELHILCKLERRRRQLQPEQDPSVSKALDCLEDQLNICEQQLQKHKEMIERMEEADNILLASNVEQQARTVVDSLKALLEAAASDRSSIPGALSGTEAAQSEEMQSHRTAVAYRAIVSAAAQRGKAIEMLSVAETHGPVDFILPWNRGGEGSKQPQPPRRVNAKLKKLMDKAFRQVVDANAAMRKPLNADEETEEGRSSSEILMEEMLRASRKAAKASEAFVHDVELMWLRAQLNNSLDLDMQVSSTLVQKAAAVVRMAEVEKDQMQRWGVEMSADDIQKVNNMLEQFKDLEEDAQSANALNEMASAAAKMKEAALQITTFVEECEKQPTRR